ncbi:MAG: MgtC/SapB family protein [Candidatus Uhrbacteria bacterium]|nr:MgtC/SapB family protein [Patescibacteria group bacterium]MBU1907138.1 MgtC/SapB family protein [Patescibacteria group bacterium]
MPEIFHIGDLEILARLVMAAILCGMIGFEREYRHRPAGIRTNALVGMGTALFTIASISFVQFGPEGSVDAARVASYVLAGIGFIGAGTIIQSRGIVKGLTTAASIWIVAAIGMVIGMGLYGPAIIATVLTMIVLVVLRNVHIEEEE